jgi:uncharacterized protein (TIGR03435 family)
MPSISKNLLPVALAIVLKANVAAPQTPTPQRLSFDVISIKPSDPGDRRVNLQTSPGGRFTGRSSLRWLVRNAYRLQEFEVFGKPSWYDSDMFDIQAKAEGDIQPGQMPLFLQSLLEERFQFKAHRETKEVPCYELVVAKAGPKLQPAKQNDVTPRIGGGGGRITGVNAEVGQLAVILSSALGIRVIDKTGTNGGFDVNLEWTPDPTEPAITTSTPVDPNGPSIFTAIQEQLGLKLESVKVPIEVLVIDSVQKPSEN